MAGTGNRFVQEKYADPKPLIKVNGRRIIEYILDIFDIDDKIIFICNDYHLQNTDMSNILLSLRPQSTIIGMPSHKNGPVFTVRAAFDHIPDEDEVLISYCDSPFVWDKKYFEDYIYKYNLDGCVVTNTGFHPHLLESTKMAFVKESNEFPLITEIQEKKSYTDQPQKEHASSGAYYFKRGSDIKKYFNLAIEKNIHHNNEFYITLVYNLLINDGMRIGYFDIDQSIMLGNPTSLENFESWARILKHDQCKNKQDIINCYEYWNRYLNK